jgi:hypothetical protein
MEGVTLVLSFTGFAAALVLGPVASLVVYFLVLFYYPLPLTVPLGSVDFNASRIVILGVLAGAFWRGRHGRPLKFEALDFWVLAQFAAMSVAFLDNADASDVLENRGGKFFDTIFPYIAMRILIDDEKKMVRLIKILTAGLVPLALMGIYEAKTGHNLYSFCARYQSWGLAMQSGDPTYMRHGLYRASASFTNIISFGLLFAAFAPLALGLMADPKWGRVRAALVAGLLMLGLVSSMSSGPLFSIMVTLAMLPLFHFRDKWPLFVVMVVVAIIFTEAFSNRHFYHVLTLFAFDPENAYYRIGLIEECFGGGMAGHWIFGYGFIGIGPGAINTDFHWEHQDLTNLYIHILARAGLVALLPYLIVNFLYFRRLYQAARYATHFSQQWLLWCFAAALAGWNISMMTVSALDQVETLLYVFIALCANMPVILRQTLLERQAALLGAAGTAMHLAIEERIWAVRLTRERFRRLPPWRRRWRWMQRFGFPRMGSA